MAAEEAPVADAGIAVDALVRDLGPAQPPERPLAAGGDVRDPLHRGGERERLRADERHVPREVRATAVPPRRDERVEEERPGRRERHAHVAEVTKPVPPAEQSGAQRVAHVLVEADAPAPVPRVRRRGGGPEDDAGGDARDDEIRGREGELALRIPARTVRPGVLVRVLERSGARWVTSNRRHRPRSLRGLAGAGRRRRWRLRQRRLPARVRLRQNESARDGERGPPSTTRRHCARLDQEGDTALVSRVARGL